MIYSAEQAKAVAEAKIEENRKQSWNMVDNLIKIVAEAGQFTTTVKTDDIISYDILESLSERYEGLGYKCEMFKGTTLSGDAIGSLKISW
jgi:hypothetical protein